MLNFYITFIDDRCGGESALGPKFWRMWNARGAEGIGGALVESQAFLGAGKRRLSGG
jgi:hypothetical protein